MHLGQNQPTSPSMQQLHLRCRDLQAAALRILGTSVLGVGHWDSLNTATDAEIVVQSLPHLELRRWQHEFRKPTSLYSKRALSVRRGPWHRVPRPVPTVCDGCGLSYLFFQYDLCCLCFYINYISIYFWIGQCRVRFANMREEMEALEDLHNTNSIWHIQP